MANKKTPAKVSKSTISNKITTSEVPGQIDILQSKLDQLQGNKDEAVSTDVMFRTEKIKDVKTVTRLLEISSSVHARAEQFENSKKRFNVTNVAPFEQDGKTVEEWDKIIAKAINELVNAKQIEILKDSIKKLEAFLDSQTKLDREVKAIMQAASAPIK